MNLRHLVRHLVRPGLLAGAALLGMTGCYTTRIHSGVPGTMPSPMATERWHHTVVLGLAEISEPIDLDGVCPPGAWATINEEVTFVNGLVAAITGQIYTPRTYTVTCSGTGPAPAGWGAPPPGAPTTPPPAQ